MDASLIALLGAGVGAVAGLSFLRQSLRLRQVRLRLDEGREQEGGVAPSGILGLAGRPHLHGGIPLRPRGPGGLADGIEITPPAFQLCERRAGRMTPALALSVAMHGAFAAAGPEAFLWISRALNEEQRLVVRFDHALRLPLMLQMPDARRVVFARRESPRPRPAAAPRAPLPRPRGLVEPVIPEAPRKVDALPAPALPSAAAAMNAPRPQRAYRTVSATTLLQPRRPAERKEIVESPAFAAWTGKVADLPSPRTVPGSPTPGMLAAAPPPRRPVLPFPSGLPVRAAPPGIEEPRLALPPPGVPVDDPPLGGAIPGSGMLTPGEPVSVISISPTPLEPGQTVQIPAVTQVGGNVEEGPSGGGAAPDGVPGGTGGADAAAAGTAAATNPAGVGSGPAAAAAGGPGQGNGGRLSQTASGVSGTGIGAGTAPGGSAGTSPGGGAGNGTGPPGAGSAGTTRGSPYVRQLRLGGQLVKMEQWPDGTLVLIFPPDGSFDVVVVENAFPEALSDLAKRLSGRPVYTAYLDVGAGREWTLHYCVPGPGQEAQQNSMVVTLEDPPPLHAPYIQRAELPPAQEWASSRYQVFHAFLTDQGKLEQVTAVRTAARGEKLLKSFSRWQFRPATRSRTAVGIELLLVVPPLPVP